MPPYLHKIATLKRPVLLVDGFAGPGKYGDGSSGSPLIICERVREAVGLKAQVSVMCIEADGALHAQLKENLKPYAFARAEHGTFLQRVSEIEGKAKTHCVFLYLDPYATDGLEWRSLDKIFAHLQSGSSIELLLNFNAVAFARVGLATLKLAPSQPIPDEEDVDKDEPPTSALSEERLNAVMGGNWWMAELCADCTFPEKVQKITDGFQRQLRTRFAEAHYFAVKADWRHKVPKYALFFASRHPDCLMLMNDAMVKHRKEMAAEAKSNQLTLLEWRPPELVPDPQQLPATILAEAPTPVTRFDLIARVMRRHFCEYSRPEIRQGIEDLLKTRKLASSTGKVRINDDVNVWVVGGGAK